MEMPHNHLFVVLQYLAQFNSASMVRQQLLIVSCGANRASLSEHGQRKQNKYHVGIENKKRHVVVPTTVNTRQARWTFHLSTDRENAVHFAQFPRRFVPAPATRSWMHFGMIFCTLNYTCVVQCSGRVCFLSRVRSSGI